MIRLLAFGALVVSAFAVGCSSTTSEAPASASSDVITTEDPDQLRDLALMSGDVTVGASSTVGYFPGGYQPSDQNGDIDAWQLPYLAWKITADAAPAQPAAPAAPAQPAGTPATGVKTQTASNTTSAPLSVKVSGNFPGLPDVLVVDANYNVIASTRAHTEHGLDVATVQVDNTPGDKLVLVRDKLWVLPMSFDISVTQ